MVGPAVFLSNNEWVDGSAPALIVALADSNTDVKTDGLLPILPQTHEDYECKAKCVDKHKPIWENWSEDGIIPSHSQWVR